MINDRKQILSMFLHKAIVQYCKNQSGLEVENSDICDITNNVFGLHVDDIAEFLQNNNIQGGTYTFGLEKQRKLLFLNSKRSQNLAAIQELKASMQLENSEEITQNICQLENEVKDIDAKMLEISNTEPEIDWFRFFVEKDGVKTQITAPSMQEINNIMQQFQDDEYAKELQTKKEFYIKKLKDLEMQKLKTLATEFMLDETTAILMICFLLGAREKLLVPVHKNGKMSSKEYTKDEVRCFADKLVDYNNAMRTKEMQVVDTIMSCDNVEKLEEFMKTVFEGL